MAVTVCSHSTLCPIVTTASAPDPLALADGREFLRMDLARKLRTSAGISLRELADWCGTSPSAIFRWEMQQRTPRGPAAVRYFNVLQRLCDRALERAGL